MNVEVDKSGEDVLSAEVDLLKSRRNCALGYNVRDNAVRIAVPLGGVMCSVPSSMMQFLYAVFICVFLYDSSMRCRGG